jgi:hypothetical protein
MHRWARVFPVLLASVFLTPPLLAQFDELQSAQSPPSPVKAEKAQEAAARHQAARTLLEIVLAGSKNLALPQNRIIIANQAFPMVWPQNEPRARALVTQMIGDFAQASASQQDNPEPGASQGLHMQWQLVIRTIAQSDAELAISFMNATSTFVQVGDSEQQQNEERGLRLELAAQEAARNPRNALRLAETDLETSGGLPSELINLLTQISAKDPEAGAQLLHETVARVRSSNLSDGQSDFSFALNLLIAQANSVPEGAPPDDSLKTLADAVASAALNPAFPEATLPILQGPLQTIEQLAPGRAPALKQKVEAYTPVQNPQQPAGDQFSQAQASGDPNQVLAVADQAPPEMRPQMVRQAAWLFANEGNLQQTRQAAEKLSDPFQRDQLLQQAVQQSAWNAANHGDFATARQIAQQAPRNEDRAIMLAQFASNAMEAKQPTVAEELLEEAAGLLVNSTPGASAFTAQLQVARAFARVKPARALTLLERSASQLQQVLTAAAEVDAFLPFQHSFEAGELVLNGSLLCNSLIQPYADAAAELANYDLQAARILADRLPLPEARLLVELSVALAGLGGQPLPAAGIGGALYHLE